MPEKKKDDTKPRVPLAAQLGGLGGELVALLVRGSPATGRRIGLVAGALVAHPELRGQALESLARVLKQLQGRVASEDAKGPVKK